MNTILSKNGQSIDSGVVRKKTNGWETFKESQFNWWSKKSNENSVRLIKICSMGETGWQPFSSSGIISAVGEEAGGGM